jgi:hypothetical protein
LAYLVFQKASSIRLQNYSPCFKETYSTALHTIHLHNIHISTTPLLEYLPHTEHSRTASPKTIATQSVCLHRTNHAYLTAFVLLLSLTIPADEHDWRQLARFGALCRRNSNTSISSCCFRGLRGVCCDSGDSWW